LDHDRAHSFGSHWSGIGREQQSGREKISRATVATGYTMVLDSSGTCDGERRMAVGNALGDCG